MKSILFCLAAPAEGEPRAPACADYVIDLAARLSAHLSIVVVAPKLQASMFIPVAAIASLLAENDRKRAGSAMAVAAAVAAIAVAKGVIASAETIHETFPVLEQTLLNRTLVHELICIARPESGDLVMPGILDSLLFQSERPVLLLDREHAGSAKIESVVVGWDGSVRAARAVWDALPILKTAKIVEIVSVTADKDISRATPGTELAAALARHGITVTVAELPRQGGAASGTLLAHAKLVRAELLVVGAYGHNRWREFILGGVTADLLNASSMPVFLSR